MPYDLCHRLMSASYCRIPDSVLGLCGTRAALSRIWVRDICTRGANVPLPPYAEYPPRIGMLAFVEGGIASAVVNSDGLRLLDIHAGAGKFMVDAWCTNCCGADEESTALCILSLEISASLACSLSRFLRPRLSLTFSTS